MHCISLSYFLHFWLRIFRIWTCGYPMYLGYFCLSMMSCLWQTFCCLTSYYGIWGFFLWRRLLLEWRKEFTMRSEPNPLHWILKEARKRLTAMLIGGRRWKTNSGSCNRYSTNMQGKLCAREKYTNDQVWALNWTLYYSLWIFSASWSEFRVF